MSWPMVDSEGWLCVDDYSCIDQVEVGSLAKCGNLGNDANVSPHKAEYVID